MAAKASKLSTQAQHVLISRNPLAGAHSGIEAVHNLAARLTELGYQASILTDLEEVQRQAIGLNDQGLLRAVVAAGGDGTVAELINRLPSTVPLALLPLGTENLLSKHVGQDRSANQVAETIHQGFWVSLDAGQAGDRVFLLMISAGFDAEVVRQVSELRGDNITRWTYAKPIWRAIRSYTYPKLRVYCDTGSREASEQREISARWIFGLNLPQYARGLQFCPDASGQDGLLDLCLFRGGGFIRGVWYLLGVITGRHQKMRDCEMIRCGQFRVEADEPVTYQLDGDFGGWLPVEIQILAERVRLVVPPSFVQSQELDIQ